MALEIDPREGTLWVVSAAPAHATLHKLQLISGRSLGTYEPAERFGPVEFVDVAAASDSSVVVLDRIGHRLLRLRPKGTALELAVTLPNQAATSIAPAAEAVVYVADADGISRVDLSSQAVTQVKSAKGVVLSGIARLRWHRGSLIAIQRSANETFRAVKIALDRQGLSATGSEVLDASLSTADPTAATIAGGVLYYLASADDPQMAVRKVMLR
jgi:hypothetical protein